MEIKWYYILFRKSLRIAAILVFIILVTSVAGCTSKPGQAGKNKTPMASLPTVSTAPKQLYIKVGQVEQFTYWGHDISINYISAYPTQKVKLTINGVERIIQKELSDNPSGIYWNEGNLSFTLKPVVWENRDSQKIPIYESTWNTTELFFEVLKGERRI